MNKELGRKKAHLSTTKTARKKNKDKIAEYDEGIEIIRKYRQRIGILEEGTKTLKVGKGIYTQKERNAYRINPNTGVYGNATIDVPKLYGQLKLIAHKDGKKYMISKWTLILLICSQSGSTVKRSILHYQKWYLMT